MIKNYVDAVVGFPREVSGFSIIRSLFEKKISIGVYDSNAKSAGLHIKGLNFSTLVPAPEKDETNFIEELLRIGDPQKRPVLIDLESAAIEIIGRYQKEVRKRYRLVLSPQDVLDIALDKAKTFQFFSDYKLSPPKTTIVENEESITTWGNHYPAVFKPRRGKGGRGQVVVKSSLEALNFLNTVQSKSDEYILQEWVPGPVTNLFTCGLLCAPGGKVRGIFSGQRLGVVQTSKIPEGVTSYARSVRVPEILDVVAKFAEKTGWEGMAEFEFKKDDRDGRYKILEINPRFWAWVQLPVSCGVDFPKLYYSIAMHGDCNPQFQFKENVYYFRCVLHLYTQLYRLRKRELRFDTFLREIATPYIRKIKNSNGTVLEDIRFRPEYYRWFSFYYNDSVF